MSLPFFLTLLFLLPTVVLSQPTTKIVCKTDPFALTCPSSSFLHIVEAWYGRTDNKTCIPATIQNTSCHGSVLSYVSNLCEGNTDCLIQAGFSSAVFNIPNPCLGTDKYLNVTWECIPLDYNSTRKVESIPLSVAWSALCRFGVIHINTASLTNISTDNSSAPDCNINVINEVIQLCETNPVCTIYQYNFGVMQCIPSYLNIDWQCVPAPHWPVVEESESCSDCVKFLAVGDWGGQSYAPYTTTTQLAVAEAMGKVGQKISSSFVVILGDNFYDTGVPNAQSIRFNVTWNHVYTAPSLQTRWYVVAGNHDWYGNVQAEVDYAKLPRLPTDKQWYFPSLNYDEVLHIPNSNRTIHAIFLDIFHLTSEAHINVPVNQTFAQITIDWLKFTLRRSSSHWKFIFTHYPFISIGKHGPNSELSSVLQPIFEEYKVDFFMTGHDHNQQHLYSPGTGQIPWGVHHFVVGGGHDCEELSVWSILQVNPSWIRFSYPPPTSVYPTTTTICAGGDWAAYCPNGEGLISISSITYGRQDNKTCGRTTATAKEPCSSNNTALVLNNLNTLCKGKNFCLVRNISNLGVPDPCIQGSYLVINWQCDYPLGGFASISVTETHTYVSIYTEKTRLLYQAVLTKNESAELPPFPPEVFTTTTPTPTPTPTPTSTPTPTPTPTPTSTSTPSPFPTSDTPTTPTDSFTTTPTPQINPTPTITPENPNTVNPASSQASETEKALEEKGRTVIGLAVVLAFAIVVIIVLVLYIISKKATPEEIV